jgi:hypothetical protein
MGAFDTSPLPPLHDSPRAWNQIEPNLNAARNFTLVSKEWYHHSRRLLYEYVILRHLASFRAFLFTLKSGAEDIRSADSIPIGHATKRIDLGLQGNVGKEIWEDQATLLEMSSIFSLCPNLRILVIDTSFDSRSFLPLAITSMLQNCPDLCHVEWKDSSFEPVPDQVVMPWLGLFPTLKVLVISTKVGLDVAHHTISFPNIHTLKFIQPTYTDTLGGILSAQFPALKHLMIQCFAHIDIEFFQGFFTRHGSQITTLDVNSSIDLDISGMLSTCTALEEFVISSVVISKNAQILSSIRSPLRRLSLLFWNGPRDPNSDPTYYMNGFSRCMQILNSAIGAGLLSHLSTVRLANFDADQFKIGGPWTLSHMSKFLEWIERWSRAKIRFEDRWGQLIAIPPYIDAYSWEWDKGSPPEDMVILNIRKSDFEKLKEIMKTTSRLHRENKAL